MQAGTAVYLLVGTDLSLKVYMGIDLDLVQGLELGTLHLATDFGDPLPMTGPLTGTLQAEWRRCGKPHCRCAQGILYGPYFHRRWREGGRQRRAYVKASDAERVRTAIAAWKRLDGIRWRLAQAGATAEGAADA